VPDDLMLNKYWQWLRDTDGQGTNNDKLNPGGGEEENDDEEEEEASLMLM
jgi:hypothetical protein